MTEIIEEKSTTDAAAYGIIAVRAELAEAHKQLAAAQSTIAAKDAEIFQLRNANAALEITAKTLAAMQVVPQLIAK